VRTTGKKMSKKKSQASTEDVALVKIIEGIFSLHNPNLCV
jgi:hypothetical protein